MLYHFKICYGPVIGKSFVFCFFETDHSLWGASLPGLEVSRRRNKGSRTKLPVSICHSGDGGPRG